MRKILVFACITFLLAGCAASFKEKRALSKPFVSIAMGKIQRNDIQGALVELRKALDANSSDAEVYYAFAMAYWKSEKYDKAVENADKAIVYADKIGLEHPGLKSEAYNLKGSILAGKGDREEAAKAFRNAVKDELYATPEYPYYNLASVLLELNRYDEARQAAQQALNSNSHYAPAWKVLSQVYLRQGSTEQAVDALRHAIIEFPGYTEAYWDLAGILIKTGHKQDAIKALNEVVRLDPNGLWGALAQQRLNDLKSSFE